MVSVGGVCALVCLMSVVCTVECVCVESGEWSVCERCVHCEICVFVVSGVFLCDLCVLRSFCVVSGVTLYGVHTAVCGSRESCACVSCLHCGMCVW